MEEYDDKYQSVKIYRIVAEGGDECYYGSTIQRLEARLRGHVGHYERKRRGNHSHGEVSVYALFDKYGVENRRIELVEDCPCNTKEELLMVEKHYIKNNPCLNKNVPLRKFKEWVEDNRDDYLNHKRGFYQEHRHELIQKAIERRGRNREHYLEYMREYNAKNKERLSAMKAEKVVCECGSVVSKRHKTRHYTSDRHQQYLMALEDRRV